MNVLIGCESSGVVREAFRKRGHNAWSCDLLPAADGSPYHIQADLNLVLNYPMRVYGPHTNIRWDLGIFHPPCTRLTNAGVRWLYKGGKGNERDPQMWAKLRDGAAFFSVCRNASIPKVAVENPIMHQYARDLIGVGCDQIIQPWEFGHEAMKATCLWLKALPQLLPTNVVGPPTPAQRKVWNLVHRESPGPDRWQRRSLTYQGIADAMAEQWGQL